MSTMLNRRLLILAMVLLVSALAQSPFGRACEPSEAPAAIFQTEPDVQEASQSLPPAVYGPLRDDHSRVVFARKDVVGKRVRVEGIAWGQPFGREGQKGTISPHAGPQVIHQGGSVFVRGIDFTESGARGKTVRVEGVLRRAPQSQSRFGDVPGYYYIEAADYEVLSSVTDPHLVLIEESH